MSRDLNKEIQQLKSRKEFDTFWNIEGQKRKIESILSGLSNMESDTQKEILKFIPVRLAAMLESQLRSSLKKLIDEVENCFENAAELLPEGKSKIEFSYFKEMKKRTFSFGEFVSHQISCNGINSFESHISNVLFKKKEGFLSEIKKYIPESIYPNVVLDSQHYCDHSDEIIKSVSRVYDLRHIVCHEMSEDLLVDEREIISLTRNIFYFAKQVNQYLANIIYPNAPETEQEMFDVASKDYKKQNEELNMLIERIKDRPTTISGLEANLELFLESQLHWEKFRETFAKSLLHEMEGGRDHRILYLEEMAEITSDRVEDLKYYFDVVK